MVTQLSYIVAVQVKLNGQLVCIDGNTVVLTGAMRLGGCQACGQPAEQYETIELVDGIYRRYWWCRVCRCLTRTA